MKKIFCLLFSALFLTMLFGKPTFISAEEDNKEARHAIEKAIIESELKARDNAEVELRKDLPNNGEIVVDEEKIKLPVDKSTLEFKEMVISKLKRAIKKNPVLSKYNVKLESIGTEDNTFSSMSATTDKVEINAPNLYSSSQGMFIKSSVYWLAKDTGTKYWIDHMPYGTGSAVDVGNPDGMGIYFDDTTNIKIDDQSFYSYDENYNSYNTNIYPHKVDDAGVYFKVQDTVKNYAWNPFHEYTWDSSHLTVWPSYSGDVNADVRTHWTHTWSGGEITGVGISTSGISVQISNSNEVWDNVSSDKLTITN